LKSDQAKSKRPQNEIDPAPWAFIETHEGGKLDIKQSSHNQINSADLDSVQNCRKVFDGMLGM
jgi:hypothetical protein